MRHASAVATLHLLLLGAAGCRSFGGTAGVTLDGRGRAGVSAELRFGPMITLADGRAMQLTMAPSLGFDGEVTFGALYTATFISVPDANPYGYDDPELEGGAAYELGAAAGSTEILRQGPNDGSMQIGLHAAYLPWTDIEEDRRAWENYGIAVDAAARWSYVEGPDSEMQPIGAGGAEPTDWWLRVGMAVSGADRF